METLVQSPSHSFLPAGSSTPRCFPEHLPTCLFSPTTPDFSVWQAEGGFLSFLGPILVQLGRHLWEQSPSLLLSHVQPSLVLCPLTMWLCNSLLCVHPRVLWLPHPHSLSPAPLPSFQSRQRVASHQMEEHLGSKWSVDLSYLWACGWDMAGFKEALTNRGNQALTSAEIIFILLKEEEARHSWRRLTEAAGSPGPASTQTACSRADLLEVSIVTGNQQIQTEVTAVHLVCLNNMQFQKILFLLTHWITWCDMIIVTHRKLRGILAVNWRECLTFNCNRFPFSKAKNLLNVLLYLHIPI